MTNLMSDGPNPAVLGPDALSAQVTQLLALEPEVEVPTVDTDLFETGILDSMAFIELLARLEQEFGTKCSMEDLDIENFRTVTRIAAFIQGKTLTSAPAPRTDVPVVLS
jgi:acyl carrier protein